jgi:hypothetical protein
MYECQFRAWGLTADSDWRRRGLRKKSGGGVEGAKEGDRSTAQMLLQRLKSGRSTAPPRYFDSLFVRTKLLHAGERVLQVLDHGLFLAQLLFASPQLLSQSLRVTGIPSFHLPHLSFLARTGGWLRTHLSWQKKTGRKQK